jgi:hypothetical protein
MISSGLLRIDGRRASDADWSTRSAQVGEVPPASQVADAVAGRVNPWCGAARGSSGCR